MNIKNGSNDKTAGNIKKKHRKDRNHHEAERIKKLNQKYDIEQLSDLHDLTDSGTKNTISAANKKTAPKAPKKNIPNNTNTSAASQSTNSQDTNVHVPTTFEETQFYRKMPYDATKVIQGYLPYRSEIATLTLEPGTIPNKIRSNDNFTGEPNALRPREPQNFSTRADQHYTAQLDETIFTRNNENISNIYRLYNRLIEFTHCYDLYNVGVGPVDWYDKQNHFDTEMTNLISVNKTENLHRIMVLNLQIIKHISDRIKFIMKEKATKEQDETKSEGNDAALLNNKAAASGNGLILPIRDVSEIVNLLKLELSHMESALTYIGRIIEKDNRAILTNRKRVQAIADCSKIYNEALLNFEAMMFEAEKHLPGILSRLPVKNKRSADIIQQNPVPLTFQPALISIRRDEVETNLHDKSHKKFLTSMGKFKTNWTQNEAEEAKKTNTNNAKITQEQSKSSSRQNVIEPQLLQPVRHFNSKVVPMPVSSPSSVSDNGKGQSLSDNKLNTVSHPFNNRIAISNADNHVERSTPAVGERNASWGKRARTSIRSALCCFPS